MYECGKLALVTALMFVATPQSAAATSPSVDSLAGTWQFQSLNISTTLAFASTISGAATFEKSANGGYGIRMVANELDVKTADGSSWATLAIEHCQGQDRDAQLTITCKIVRVATPQYGADNFVLHINGEGSMTGTMNSNQPVTFTRVD